MKKLVSFRTPSGALAWSKAWNVLALIVAVAMHFGYTGALPEEWEAFVLPIVVIINYLLRTFWPDN